MNYILGIIVSTAALVANVASQPHLVTMQKKELMEIINCVNDSKDPTLCARFTQCEARLPSVTFEIYTKCENKFTNKENRLKKCHRGEKMYTDMEIPMKIYDCIVEKSSNLNATETKQMIEFEHCCRDLYASCRTSQS